MTDSKFQVWSKYYGLLLDDEEGSRIYGFENKSTSRAHGYNIPKDGAVYGYVFSGMVGVNDKVVKEQEYFSTANGAAIGLLTEDSAVFCVQRLGWLGINLVGGPIEKRGRLRYIDTCSDSLLIGPPLKGDPCLNHLHFPTGIDQTSHTHPSTRAGMVARGKGMCVTPDQNQELLPGMIFYIGTDGEHKFQTPFDGYTMDVVPYHPDSDFGPENEEHPMVNRTWVEGEKIDNSSGRHAFADVLSTEIKDLGEKDG